MRARAAKGGRRRGGPTARGKAANAKAPPKKARVTKADVTGPIERESARLLRIVRELGEERASKAVVADWSARDVAAHCVYWQGMLARMMGAALPPPSWIPRWQSEHELGTDELNRLTVEHYRGFAFDTLLADFEFTAGLVRRIVSEMKEENLLLEAGPPWDPGTRVHEAIAGETHAHWKEHADEVEERLRSGPGAAGREARRRPKATAEKKALH